ncbi:hypothetical protein MMC30_002270 [Trapelia coarctata]|nr:hypothetical protein [Trapelia coarctata]
MRSLATLLLLATGSAVLAQSSGCQPSYSFGTDTVLFTTPYTYAQVMSITGSYKNLTWSGNPDDTVTLDGVRFTPSTSSSSPLSTPFSPLTPPHPNLPSTPQPDNTVNTTRTYSNSGALVIERITLYSKPSNGPYIEIHTLAPLTIPAANLSFYSDYDYTSVTPVCDGKASAFNLTIPFCATNASLAESVLHGIHLADVQTVGVFLGGQNFTSCEALGGGANATATKTGTGVGPTMTIVTANEAGRGAAVMGIMLGVMVMAMMVL